MSIQPIYLDHAATTPVRPEVLEAMLPFYGPRFGNPSSTHRWGREARAALDEARERVAQCLGANTDEICFTSCGTEGDNLAVIGAWRVLRTKGRNAVVTTPIEHKAILGATHQIAKEGGEERILDVDGDGIVDSTSFDSLVKEDTAVCSVMWVNNETGVIQNIPSLAAKAKERGGDGLVFHTDAIQAFGKIEIDAKTQAFDLLAISGHKIGAPKGVGALYIRRGTPMEPLMFGGSQDRGRRPGTENVAYVVGLATAAELAVKEREDHWKKTERMRNDLEQLILDQVPDAVVHSRGAERAPHVLNISVPGTDSESMLMALDLRGIACSGGSACQSGSVGSSHVLSAMRVEPSVGACAIRMSLGATNTDEEIARVASVFTQLVAKARGMAAA